jgi:tetratricopeptide (TPR) repeat protein
MTAILLASLIALVQETPAKKLAELDKAIQERPSHFLYYERGSLRQGLGDFDGSIADLTVVLESAKGKYRAQTLEIRAFSKLGKSDVDGAVADLTEAIQSDPENWLYYSDRAMARIEKGDYDGAKADAEAALKLDPKNTTALAHRGRAKAGIGDDAGALADLNAAIQADPGTTFAIMERARIHQAAGRWKEAAADLKLAGDSDKEFGWWIAPQVWCVAIHLGSAADATRELRKATASMPEGKIFEWPRATVRFLLGELDEAGLRKAASPTQAAMADYYVGMRRLAADDKPGASKAFKACVEASPKWAELRRIAERELQLLKN